MKFSVKKEPAYTPLMLAIVFGLERVACRILECGADGMLSSPGVSNFILCIVNITLFDLWALTVRFLSY